MGRNARAVASVPRYSNFILHSRTCHLSSRRDGKYGSPITAIKHNPPAWRGAAFACANFTSCCRSPALARPRRVISGRLPETSTGVARIKERAHQLTIHAVGRSREPPAKSQLGNTTVVCAISSGSRRRSKAAPLQGDGDGSACGRVEASSPNFNTTQSRSAATNRCPSDH
jgi:hypothetical protein